MLNYFRQVLEKKVFGVCQWWGGKLSIRSSRIRMFFIYASFVAMGSPLIVYLIMAFVLEHKQHFKGVRRKRVWDL